jgi:integrase
MARGKIGRLNVSNLKSKKAGLIADGGNLYLKTEINSERHISRSWIFRFQLPGGKVRDMGLGPVTSVNLALARQLAADNRALVATGVDPIEHRNTIIRARRISEAVSPAPTFDVCARDYIQTHRSGWRNPRHHQQWTNTLAAYASPVIGKLPVDEITTDHVLKIVKPLWHEKTDTMKRVRSRIELVLDYAAAMKKRSGDNPARWSGGLKHLLAPPSKVSPTQHHPALDYKRMNEFMAALHKRQSISALAFEFTILTCARTGETLGAVWSEFDLDEALWTVPANRIKAGREHQVPLSKQAMAVLRKVRAITEKIGGDVAKSSLVFPNKSGKRLGSRVLAETLERMEFRDITVHGFRSSFRDWAGEESHFPNDVIEMALAHRVGDKTEQAYRRKTGFQKRRQLADAWSNYCAKAVAGDAKVLTLVR